MGCFLFEGQEGGCSDKEKLEFSETVNSNFMVLLTGQDVSGTIKYGISRFMSCSNTSLFDILSVERR